MLSVFAIVGFGPKSLLNTVLCQPKLWLSIAKSEPTGYVREREVLRVDTISVILTSASSCHPQYLHKVGSN